MVHKEASRRSNTWRWCAATERGLAVFQKLRRRQNEASAFLFAFDLLQLDGTDMRGEPIEVRTGPAGRRIGSSSRTRRLVL
jgi:hypothetical protein